MIGMSIVSCGESTMMVKRKSFVGWCPTDEIKADYTDFKILKRHSLDCSPKNIKDA